MNEQSDDSPKFGVPRPRLPLTSRWFFVSLAALAWGSFMHHNEVPAINMLSFTPGLLVVDLVWIALKKALASKSQSPPAEN